MTDRVPITPLTQLRNCSFQVIYLDCIGPLGPVLSQGHGHALCVIDLCPRWPELVPLEALTPRQTCQALLDIFSHFSIRELV